MLSSKILIVSGAPVWVIFQNSVTIVDPIAESHVYGPNQDFSAELFSGTKSLTTCHKLLYRMNYCLLLSKEFDYAVIVYIMATTRMLQEHKL